LPAWARSTSRVICASAVSAHPGGAHHQPAADVQGGTGDGVAGTDLGRHRLAGQQRGVHRGLSLVDGAVGGDGLPGADHEQVADPQRRRRDGALPAVRAEYRRLLGAELGQRTQCRAGPPLGPRLGVPPGQDEHGDRGGHLQVRLAAGHQRVRRPQVRRGDAETDEGVHGRRAVPGVRGGGPVERPGAPDRDRGGKREGQPLPVREVQRRHHGQRQHRDGQRGADQQPAARPGGDQPGTVHSGRVEGYGGPLGGVVDRGLHAVELVQLAFDPRRAGRAGHPVDGQFDVRRTDRPGAHVGGAAE